MRRPFDPRFEPGAWETSHDIALGVHRLYRLHPDGPPELVAEVTEEALIRMGHGEPMFWVEGDDDYDGAPCRCEVPVCDGCYEELEEWSCDGEEGSGICPTGQHGERFRYHDREEEPDCDGTDNDCDGFDEDPEDEQHVNDCRDFHTVPEGAGFDPRFEVVLGLRDTDCGSVTRLEATDFCPDADGSTPATVGGSRLEGSFRMRRRLLLERDWVRDLIEFVDPLREYHDGPAADPGVNPFIEALDKARRQADERGLLRVPTEQLKVPVFKTRACGASRAWPSVRQSGFPTAWLDAAWLSEVSPWPARRQEGEWEPAPNARRDDGVDFTWIDEAPNPSLVAITGAQWGKSAYTLLVEHLDEFGHGARLLFQLQEARRDLDPWWQEACWDLDVADPRPQYGVVTDRIRYGGRTYEARVITNPHRAPPFAGAGFVVSTSLHLGAMVGLRGLGRQVSKTSPYDLTPRMDVTRLRGRGLHDDLIDAMRYSLLPLAPRLPLRPSILQAWAGKQLQGVPSLAEELITDRRAESAYQLSVDYSVTRYLRPARLRNPAGGNSRDRRRLRRRAARARWGQGVRLPALGEPMVVDASDWSTSTSATTVADILKAMEMKSAEDQEDVCLGASASREPKE